MGSLLAGGLMPRVIFEKLATLQLLDVRVPTTDGRELCLVRRIETIQNPSVKSSVRGLKEVKLNSERFS